MVSWIRLETNLFDNPKIQMLSNLPKGDSYVSFWVRLLCMAGKLNNGGYVYVAENAAYTPQLLAAITGKPVALVKTMLKTMQELHMIDVDTNGIIYIIGWNEHQNIAGLEKIREQTRERTRLYRERKKQSVTSNSGDASQCVTSDATSDGGNDTVTQQNKNNNKKENKNIENYDDDDNSISPIPFQEKRNTKAIQTTTTSTLAEEVDSKAITDNVFLVWQDNISPITPIVGEKIKALIEECGEDAVLHGIGAACEQNVRTIPYVTACARNYLSGRSYSGGKQCKNDVTGTAQKVLEAIERGDGDAIWG